MEASVCVERCREDDGLRALVSHFFVSAESDVPFPRSSTPRSIAGVSKPPFPDSPNRQVPFVPRPIASRQRRRRPERRYPALPPSTNCPPSFERLYRSTFDSAIDSFLALPPSTNCPEEFLARYHCDLEGDRGDDGERDDAKRDGPPALLADVVPRVLSYCDARTLSRASVASRSWCAMANADELWERLCVETFGVASSELRPPPDPTRTLYVMSHRRLRSALRGRRTVWGGGYFGLELERVRILPNVA
ncbi:hypothetical protein ACHAWF_004395 [Thalassiosira exigua]